MRAYKVTPLLTIANIVLLSNWNYSLAGREDMASESMQGSSVPGTGTGAAAVKAGFTERRANRRYEIKVEFEVFHLWGANHLIWAGAGKTRNWSRNSILIDWDKPLPAGSSVELVVRWSPGVQLMVVGRVLNSAARGTVVRILRRRFQTAPALADIPRSARRRPAPMSDREQAS